MTEFLYWFGVFHAAAYLLTGAAIVLIWAAEKVIKKAGIGAAMLKAYRLYRKDKHDAGFFGA